MVHGTTGASHASLREPAFLRWAIPFGAVVALTAVSNQLYSGMAAMGILAFFAVRKRPGGTLLKPDRSEAWLFAFCLLAMLSYLWAPSELDGQGRTIFLEYGGVFAVYFLARRIGGEERAWNFLGACYVVGALLAGVLILADWRAGGSADAGGRYSIAGVNANYSAYAMATAVPVAAALYWRRERRIGWTLALLSTLAFLTFSVALTGCRGGLLAVLASLAILMARELRMRPALSVIVATAGGYATWSAWSWIEDSVPGRIFGRRGAGEDVSSGRFDLWGRAMEVFERNPVVGTGADSFPAVHGGGMYAHNVFLNVLAELGASGTVLLAMALAMIWWKMLRTTNPGWARMAGVMLVVTWLVIASTGVWLLASPAWFAFGWLAGIRGSGERLGPALS